MVRDINENGSFEDNEVFFFAKDHLGSVHALTNKQGTPVQRYSYSGYGKTKVVKLDGSDKMIKNPYGYTAREWEEETGDYYYRARYYDPKTGRFLSEDPIGMTAGDPNLYRYTANNPIRFRDPSGNLSPASGTACAIGFAAGELYDIYSNIKAATDLTEATENKLNALDEESKTCSSKRRDQIRFEKQKILDDYQKNSMVNVLDVFAPGAGAITATGACLLFISTF